MNKPKKIETADIKIIEKLIREFIMKYDTDSLQKVFSDLITRKAIEIMYENEL